MRAWNVDESLCDVALEGAPRQIHLRAEVVDEPYRAHTPAREFVPLSVTSGTRTRLIGQLYQPEAGAGASRERRIGEADAYFYHEDCILLLWRCRIVEPCRQHDPNGDALLHAVWEGFDRFLHRRFPDARSMVTPAWNLPYPSRRWLLFLAAHGFTQPSPTGLSGMAYVRPRTVTPPA